MLITMVGSYALLAACLIVLALAVGYVAGLLIFLSYAEPSWWVLLADIGALLTLVFVFSRKRVRTGLKYLGTQLLRNF